MSGKCKAESRNGAVEMFINDIPSLPFEIDRKSWIKLPHQVADGIRRCIVDGFWKPGDKLPSARALASELGVSFRVAVEALRILAKEGRVSLRAKSCAVVNVEETLQKNHRILLVLSGGVQYFMSMTVYDRVRARLSEAGYIVTFLTLPRVGVHSRYDIAQLRAELRRQYELVVCQQPLKHVLDIIKASGQPFAIVLGGKMSAKNFVGNISRSFADAAKAFAVHCARRRVRRVVVVAKWVGDGDEVIAALSSAGVAAERWIVPTKVCTFRGERVERAAFDAFSRRIVKKGRSWLPDVLYFSDDFLCHGAMTAMLTHGIRVPEDVCVVSIAVKGSRRAYKTTLTRVEYDAEAMGDKAADGLLEYLRNGEFPQGCVLSATYRIGGSFR